MADSYSVRAQLSATDNGFTSTLNKAVGAVGNLGSSIKSGLSFGFLTGAGQAAFSAITNGARDLIGEIDASNAAWKTFEDNLSMLEGWDPAGIDAARQGLQKFAQDTVYSSSEMAQTFAQLAAVGVPNTEALVTGFGGLAAAAENPQQAMRTLSQQATQMAAKPTVAWADFKLMLEQTPAGIAAVAREMGMTTGELVTAVQEGEVATTDFFNTIATVGNSEAFADMAREAKTVGQALDGLKETAANKLLPAFDVLSQAGIAAVDGLAGALDGIDAQALADKVGAAVDTVTQYWNTFKSSFSGVGTALSDAFGALSSSLREVFGVADGASALETFKSVCDKVAAGIKTVAGFIEENADTIAKYTPLVLKLVGAFAGMSIIGKAVPGLSSFAGSLAQMAGKGIGGLVGKLFGVAGGQTAVGTASATSAPSVLQSAAATLMLGAAVLLASAGLALLVQSAIALASAGWPAVAALVGLGAAIVGLAIGAAAIGPALTAGAPGLLAFGAAIALIGVGAVLAGAGLAIVSAVLPTIITYGAQGAVAIAQLGMSMTVFAVGAALAGAACIVLGAGLLVVAAALVVAGAGMILIGAGALLAAAALAIMAAIMPTLAASGTAGAVAIVALGAALIVFGAGAVVAGAAAIVLGAGLAVAAVGIAAAGVAAAVLAAAMLVIGTSAILAGVGIALVATSLPILCSLATESALALTALGLGLVAFTPGAVAAGAAAVVLGAGIAVCAAGVALLGAGLLIVAAAFLALSVAAMVGSASLTLFSVALPAFSAHGTAAAAAIAALGASFGVFAVSAGAGAVAIGAFGIAIAGAAIATAAMALSLVGVSTQMAGIARNAKAAEKSLDNMEASAGIVEAGLDALGSMAESAMSALCDAFDGAEADAKASAKGLTTGFSNAFKSGMNKVPAVARSAASRVSTALRAGYSGAYSAGSYISIGFANGMRSQLGTIRAAASQMAAAADAAVRAKAQIASPSKVSTGLGAFWGEGFANGIANMAGDVRAAASRLVSIPNVATPDLAMAYGGEMSGEYSYYRNSDYTIEVPLSVDGRVFARATATYTQDELNRQQTRESRKHGRV